MNYQIGLRFRDTIPGIDTIEEHKKILKVPENSVWWGWWRKSHEDKHEETLSGIDDGKSFKVFLIDVSTERLYHATCECVRRQLTDTDLESVPKYYRASAEHVEAWFLLSSLEDISSQFNRLPKVPLEETF